MAIYVEQVTKVAGQLLSFVLRDDSREKPSPLKSPLLVMFPRAFCVAISLSSFAVSMYYELSCDL